jgi:hypothetical protein
VVLVLAVLDSGFQQAGPGINSKYIRRQQGWGALVFGL